MGWNMSKEKLIELAEDLVSAIENAAWITSDGEVNLTAPTPHMKNAIENFKEYVYPKCSTCGQELPR